MADRLDRIGKDVRVSFAYQEEALGLGHAVGCGRDAVGDEPFAVLLPDELMGDPSLLDQMARVCERTGGGVVGVKPVPWEEVDRYGVIDPAGEVDADGVVAVRTMVEKPARDVAPSNMILIGRYVLTPDVFDRIGEGVLFTHSQRGGPGWLTAIKNPRVKGIVAFEPGSGSCSPTARYRHRSATSSTPSPPSRSR